MSKGRGVGRWGTGHCGGGGAHCTVYLVYEQVLLGCPTQDYSPVRPTVVDVVAVRTVIVVVPGVQRLYRTVRLRGQGEYHIAHGVLRLEAYPVVHRQRPHSPHAWGCVACA